MNPYEHLPAKAFWNLSVAETSTPNIEELWDPKFNVHPTDDVVTFGSCFAQHIGNALKTKGFNWLCTEPPPPGLSPKNAALLNYNRFSARTGNIYTTSLLKQWVEWALDRSEVPPEVWQLGGRFYDPFRPRIEPNGFLSEGEMQRSRTQAISSFRQSIVKAHYFVFTLGLTESWVNTKGYEYPICPGAAAGDFDPASHKFKNQLFQEVREHLDRAILMMRELNSNINFILTVSPVPLVATNSKNHVLVANMGSKSILRAVAGELAANRSYIDYFPAYELIASPAFEGVFFERNRRTVSPGGVDFVMSAFFECLRAKFGDYKTEPAAPLRDADSDQACEDELLRAFSKQ